MHSLPSIHHSSLLPPTISPSPYHSYPSLPPSLPNSLPPSLQLPIPLPLPPFLLPYLLLTLLLNLPPSFPPPFPLPLLRHRHSIRYRAQHNGYRVRGGHSGVRGRHPPSPWVPMAVPGLSLLTSWHKRNWSGFRWRWCAGWEIKQEVSRSWILFFYCIPFLFAHIFCLIIWYTLFLILLFTLSITYQTFFLSLILFLSYFLSSFFSTLQIIFILFFRSAGQGSSISSVATVVDYPVSESKSHALSYQPFINLCVPPSACLTTRNTWLCIWVCKHFSH